jgi:hypothetical protein
MSSKIQVLVDEDKKEMFVVLNTSTSASLAR